MTTMAKITICIKDINKLSAIDVAGIYNRLSWENSSSSSSIRVELEKRYMWPEPGPHPEMAIALIWLDDVLTGWVGTRPWPEKFKGKKITAQTIECFVDPTYRRRGIATLGVQALITAGYINRKKIVSVYAQPVVKLARQCGCKLVIYCDS